MRQYRYDARDMLHAFVLAFDIRRLMLGTLAAAWTLACVLIFYGIFAWRAATGPLAADSLFASEVALRAMLDFHPTPERVALWIGLLGLWWLGYSRLIAPILRSGAVEIARDRRLRFSDMAVASRRVGGLVTWAPFAAAAVPLLCLVFTALWALSAKIGGVAGEVIAVVLLPVALLLGFIGALSLLTTVCAAPLMGPAAAFEGHDVLESASRAISYFFQRPFRFFGFWLLKLLLSVAAFGFGALILCLTWGFVLAALHAVGEGETASQAVRLVVAPGELPGPRTAQEIDNWTPAISPVARVLGGSFWATALLAAGWWVVIVAGLDLFRYALLRYQVDGATYDEITIPQEFLEAHRHLNAAHTAAQAAKAREQSPDPAPVPEAADSLKT